MRHCLITGGAGFIGSHTCTALLAAGWRVTVLDNFDPFYSPAAKSSNIELLRTNPYFRVFEVDICDLASLRSHGPEHYDAILHLAAKAGVRLSIDEPFVYQSVNVGGTLNLLEFARERGIKQFVLASSSSVYGINSNLPWCEDDRDLLPISPYASTKLSAESLGHVYSQLYGTRFIALRLFTVYGPKQRPDLAIRKFADQMLNGRTISIYGNGDTRRDYTFVSDVVQGIRAALDFSETKYEVINLGSGRAVTVLEVIRNLEMVLGVDARIRHETEHSCDVAWTLAKIDKAKRLLGYSPKTEFVAGLRAFASWLKVERGL